TAATLRRRIWQRSRGWRSPAPLLASSSSSSSAAERLRAEPGEEAAEAAVGSACGTAFAPLPLSPPLLLLLLRRRQGKIPQRYRKDTGPIARSAGLLSRAALLLLRWRVLRQQQRQSSG